MIKKILLLLALALSVGAWSQNLDFLGVPMGGTIQDFTETVRQRFPLQKKVGGDHYYIYKGSIFGHETYFKAEYSRKTKTVYKITVTPQQIDQTAYLDSLVAHYGDPLEVNGGYRWNREGGTVFLYLPGGYDPVLMYFDTQGVATFKEEK
jgi:hypothetical protein